MTDTREGGGNSRVGESIGGDVDRVRRPSRNTMWLVTAATGIETVEKMNKDERERERERE